MSLVKNLEYNMLTISNIQLVHKRVVGVNWIVNRVKEHYSIPFESECYVINLKPTNPTIKGKKIPSASIVISREANEDGNYLLAICWNSYTNKIYEELVSINYITEFNIFRMAMIVLNKKINSL